MGSPPDDLPLSIWRLSNYNDLSGRGGLIASGRWHTLPKPVLYCADEPFTAYCEALQRFSGSPLLIPDRYKLLKISVPQNASLQVVDGHSLDPSWRDMGAAGWQVCRPIGDAWLVSLRTAILKVPSAARLGWFNYLVNPVHRQADDFEIVEVLEQPFPGWVINQA